MSDEQGSREGEGSTLELGGDYVFDSDDGFQVVFQPADRRRPLVAFIALSALVIAITLWLLSREPELTVRTWLVAITLDFAAILTLHIARKHATKAPLIIDGAERRIFLQGGAEVAFDRLRFLRLHRDGPRAELLLGYEEGVVRIGPRPAEELEEAAPAVARVTGLPLEG